MVSNWTREKPALALTSLLLTNCTHVLVQLPNALLMLSTSPSNPLSKISTISDQAQSGTLLKDPLTSLPTNLTATILTNPNINPNLNLRDSRPTCSLDQPSPYTAATALATQLLALMVAVRAITNRLSLTSTPQPPLVVTPTAITIAATEAQASSTSLLSIKAINRQATIPVFLPTSTAGTVLTTGIPTTEC